MSNAVLNLKHCTKIKDFVHKLHYIFCMISSYCFLNYLFNLGSLFYWPLLFYDFQEVSAVIICCSHSCFKINIKSSLLRICHCQTLEEKNPISTKSIAKKEEKCHLFCTMQYQTTLRLLLTSKYVFLLNWKNGKWRHQDAGLRRSVHFLLSIRHL